MVVFSFTFSNFKSPGTLESIHSLAHTDTHIYVIVKTPKHNKNLRKYQHAHIHMHIQTIFFLFRNCTNFGILRIFIIIFLIIGTVYGRLQSIRFTKWKFRHHCYQYVWQWRTTWQRKGKLGNFTLQHPSILLWDTNTKIIQFLLFCCLSPLKLLVCIEQ